MTIQATAAVVPAPTEFVPGQILVKPKTTLAESDFTTLLSSHGAVEQFSIDRINVRVLSVPEEKAESVLETLRQNPNIEFAERDYIATPAFVPNDPYVVSGSEWHLAKIQAPQAWDNITGSTNVIIAVIDSGINSAHPDLAGNILPGYDFVSNDGDADDDLGHGTAVTGVAAASGNNGIGVAGVAFGCGIMPLKVFSATVNATYSRIAQAVNYATDHGARAINISLSGSSFSSTLQSAINYAWSNNVVIVAGAGNNANSTRQYPAGCQNVVGVSATEINDGFASFSSFGNFVALSAPGRDIWTTKKDLASPYSDWWGTSFASPIVVGVAALVALANPSLSNTQIVSILKFSADDLGAAGYDIYFGYGRVNAFRAVTAATNSLPVITTQPASQTIADGGTATFTIVSTGADPRRYQWKFKGTNISGATTLSLTKANLQFSDAGDYSVVVSNVFATVTSAPATLTVTAVPPIIQHPARAGSNQVTITWSAINGRKYRVQYAPALCGTNWTSLTPDITAAGPTASKVDQPNGAAQRFYRVLQLP